MSLQFLGLPRALYIDSNTYRLTHFVKQLLYETCLCVWLLSYYEPAIEYLATSRALPRLMDVVKSSTKEKVRILLYDMTSLFLMSVFSIL